MIGNVPLNVFALIMLNDIMDAVSQLLMKQGIGKLTLFFWLGVLIYVSNFFLWMRILSKIELSVALPIASAGYMLVPVLSIIFLGEQVSMLRWLGIIFIVLGVYFVSQSKQESKLL